MKDTVGGAPRWEVVCDCGPDGAVVRAFGDTEAMLGIEPAALVGVQLRTLVHPDDANSGVGPVDVRTRHVDGTWRVLEWVGGTDGGERTVWLRDLTELRSLRQEVELWRGRADSLRSEAETSQRALTAQETAIEVLARDEPVADTLAAIVELVETVVAPLNAAILVFEEGDLIAREASAGALADGWYRQRDLLPALRASSNGWIDVGPDADSPRLFRWSQLIDSGFGVLGAFIVTSRHQRFPSEEEVRISEVAVRLARVVLERRRARERLDHRDQHDELTGLPNRVAFMAGLIHEIVRSAGRLTLATLSVDIDHFEHINDAYGHAAGDQLLIEVAERLRNTLRSNDLLARVGGDKFATLCRVDGLEHARLVGERIQRELDLPFNIQGTIVRVSSSIGVALSQPMHSDEMASSDPIAMAEALVRDADTALHRSKRDGRDRLSVFDDALRNDLLVRLDTESALRGALDRGEFELVFQPVLRLADNSIEGAEALLRWRRADGRVRLPGEFIALAEETGLILEIGAWVMEEAAAQSARWRGMRPDSPPCVLSINLSARQVVAPGFVDEVRTMLRRSGAKPSSLYLEITESLFVSDFDGTVEVLHELRDLGLRIVIDDFGTGYSSLQYLKRLPIDMIKIDRSFVEEIDRSPQDLAIARAVIDVAHAFGYGVVAEGVERPEQVQVLRTLGCELAQGFLLARPQSVAEIDALLEHPGDAVG